MRRLLGAVTILAALATWAPAANAAGGPIFPGGAYGSAGVVGPGDNPGTQYRYVMGDGGARGTTLAKVVVGNGRVLQWRYSSPGWVLPAATVAGDAATGLSADGDTLVLANTRNVVAGDVSRFLVIDTRKLRLERRLNLDGHYSLDAISPNGRLLYLVEYESPRDPLNYRVRAYDLAKREFLPGEIVDPSEPNERMRGYPMERAMSPDGRWAYTLYAGGEETFIHALDTRDATARCIDLHGFSGGELWVHELSVDPESGVISAEHGKEEAWVDPETFEVTEGTPPLPAAGVPAPAGAADTAGDSSPLLLILGGAALLAAIAAVMGIRRRARDTDG